MSMKNPKAHIAGIGGEGWSAIAKVLIERGWEIEGCDATYGDRVKDLEKIGLKKFTIGNSADHVSTDFDYFLYNDALTYFPESKKEVDKAFELKIPTYNRDSFFPILLKDNDVIGIAGTHGKTTTTAMTSYLLDVLGDKCGFIIGGTSKNFETNARKGESSTFVIEADEFQDSFLGLNPKISLITSLEYDHPDYFKTETQYLESFLKFAKNTREDGLIIGFGDNKNINEILNKSEREFITYGENSDNDASIKSIEINGFMTDFEFEYKGKMHKAEIPFPGKQYAYNALAALLVVSNMGYEIEKAIPLLKNFKGTSRRFDYVEKNGITVINDYGHHPTELKITTEGALKTGKRVLVLYEPHQYKRCFELKDQFRGVFNGANLLLQAEIYASREEEPYPITNEEFFDVSKDGVLESQYVGSWDKFSLEVMKYAKSGDIILVLAVGHGSQIVQQILEKL